MSDIDQITEEAGNELLSRLEEAGYLDFDGGEQEEREEWRRRFILSFKAACEKVAKQAHKEGMNQGWNEGREHERKSHPKGEPWRQGSDDIHTIWQGEKFIGVALNGHNAGVIIEAHNASQPKCEPWTGATVREIWATQYALPITPESPEDHWVWFFQEVAIRHNASIQSKGEPWTPEHVAKILGHNVLTEVHQVIADAHNESIGRKEGEDVST